MNVFCRGCGEQNSAEARYCSTCRSRLSEGRTVTEDSAQAHRTRRVLFIRRKRLMIWSAVAVIVLGLGVWIGVANFGTARFLPGPSSDISAAPVDGDWPMVQRDPGHAASTSGDSAELTGQTKWLFEIDSPIFTSPAVTGDRVYLSTGDSRILALDARSGDLLWEHEVSGPVNSSPAVAGDFVYVGLREGTVLSLDKDTGDVQWDFRTGDAIYSSPSVHQGVLYIGSRDGKVYALDAVTGDERWSYLTGGRITSNPAVNQEVTAVIAQDWYLYLVDHRTGRLRLDFPTSSVNGSPSFHDNLLFISDERGVVRAIDWRQSEKPFEKFARRVRTQLFAFGLTDSIPPLKGSVWGFREFGETFIGTPAVANDTVYIGSNSGTLFAIEELTGESRWQINVGAPISTSPSVIGDSVLFGDKSGVLHSVDAITGDPQWQFTADAQISSTPVFANGTLYLASRAGSLYAIE